MVSLFEEFKSGKRTDIYMKDLGYLVYAKFKEDRNGKLAFYTQSIGSRGSYFVFEEGEVEFREMSGVEISAELFYEAYNVYVKYQSCADALTEIFNRV